VLVQTLIVPPDLSSRPFHLSAERIMKAPPAVLYRAWTEELDRWFASPGSVLMDPGSDSAFFFETHMQGKRHAHYGRFLRLEASRIVEITWMSEGTRGAETVVTIIFTPAGSGTHLRLTHMGFPDDNSRKAHQDAWPMVLAQLDDRMSNSALDRKAG
jgi:uncharacterized protein YndB with AHSA1/START domain